MPAFLQDRPAPFGELGKEAPPLLSEAAKIGGRGGPHELGSQIEQPLEVRRVLPGELVDRPGGDRGPFQLPDPRGLVSIATFAHAGGEIVPRGSEVF